MTPSFVLSALWTSLALGGGQEPPPPRARLAVPEASALKEPERQVKEVYKDDYARKGPADQQALAKRLLSQGTAADATEPEVRFVLLREARDLALAAGDFAAALQAIDGLGEHFELDALVAKVALLSKAKPGRGVEGTAEYAKALCLVLEEGLANGEVEAVAELATKAETAGRASENGTLAARSQALAKDVRFAEKEAKAVRPHRKTLETKPDDKAANLAVGRFLCLVIGAWRKGLPLLAKGSDAALGALAERELAGPEESAAQASLGDAWWELADKERNAELKKRLREHAVVWYEKALPGASGLAKVRIEQRIRETGRIVLGSGRLSKSAAVGGSGGAEFEEVPKEGGLLVGLRYTLSPYGSSVIVKSVQGIYLAGPQRIDGGPWGRPGSEPQEVVAKPGYAVAGIQARAGIRLDAMKIVFMRVGPAGLDPRDKYESAWIGGTAGGAEVKIAGDGAFVVGLHGRAADDLDAFGLVQIAR